MTSGKNRVVLLFVWSQKRKIRYFPNKQWSCNFISRNGHCDYDNQSLFVIAVFIKGCRYFAFNVVVTNNLRLH